MERLEAKRVKGHTYYYYSKWARLDNRCRRVWQRYLGKLEDIVAAVQGGGPAPIAAEVFQWGLPQALWQEATRAQLVELIDRHCPKRRQGLTTGQYLAIAAINRAISPRSKRSMWVWFSQTVLRRHMPSASEAALASQRFWDHMDSVTPEAAAAMWKDLLKGVIDREQIDLSSILLSVGGGDDFPRFSAGARSLGPGHTGELINPTGPLPQRTGLQTRSCHVAPPAP